jgi:CBS-domain-containing membrane protein
MAVAASSIITIATIAANIVSFLIRPSLLSSVLFAVCVLAPDPIRREAPRKWAKAPRAVWAFVPVHVPAVRGLPRPYSPDAESLNSRKLDFRQAI